VSDGFKAGVSLKVGDVGFRPGEIVIDDDDFVASTQKPLGKVRSHKSGAAGYQNTHGHDVTAGAGSIR
jgi:hypothetical protein